MYNYNETRIGTGRFVFQNLPPDSRSEVLFRHFGRFPVSGVHRDAWHAILALGPILQSNLLDTALFGSPLARPMCALLVLCVRT